MLLSEEKLRELAHRRATRYTHRSDPKDCAYGFTGAHLDDLVRDIAAVLAEQAKAEPVCYLLENAPGRYAQASKEFAEDVDVFPVFRHPAPAPEGMVKDAERYRWLRDAASHDDWDRIGVEGSDTLDSAIDSAMAAEKESGK